MKTGDDFRREFPEIEDSFLDAAHRALSEIHAEKEEKPMKLRPMLVFVLMLVLLTSVSVAATWERWSLDDFIPTGRITATEDEWRKMIDAFEPVTAENDVANVTVREALYDGYALYIVMDVEPLNPHDFFVPEMTEMDAAARRAADSLPADMSLREYVVSQGYTRILEVRMSTGQRGLMFMPEMELNEDGTMTFYLRQRIQEQGDPCEDMQVMLYVSMKPTMGSWQYSVKAPLTLQCLPVLQEANSPEGERHEFEGCGVVMSNVHMIRTPLSTYVTVEVEVSDEEQYANHFGNTTLRFVDIGGQEYDVGPFNACGFMRDLDADAEPGAPYYMATLTMEEIPDRLLLIEMPSGKYDPDKVSDSWEVPLETKE